MKGKRNLRCVVPKKKFFFVRTSQIFRLLFAVCVAPTILLLPGCVKTYKILKEESPQGIEHEIDTKIIDENLRSVRVYDQWATKAHFDALYLSEPTRKAYTDLYCRKRGKDAQFKQAFLQKQHDEYRHAISFYVLGDTREDPAVPLSDFHAAWTMYLEALDGATVSPLSIQIIEEDALPPEIKAFFGYKAVFKTFYLVKFPTNRSDGTTLLASGSPFKLVFSSVERDAEMYWGDHPGMYDRKDKKKVSRVRVRTKKGLQKHEDRYWL